MLRELHIRNYAIIEEQLVSFGEGLNVITGETGAGKSIVLDALQLLFGGRASADSIRDGADELEISATFAVPQARVELLPDIARSEELSVARSFARSGRGKVYINGKLATVSLLEEVMRLLVDLCGQSAQVRLLEPKFHLELIDLYRQQGEGARREKVTKLGESQSSAAGASTAFASTAVTSPAFIRPTVTLPSSTQDELISDYRRVFERWREAQSQLQAARNESSFQESRQLELEDAVAEIEAVRPAKGLRQDLEQQVQRLGAVEKISSLTAAVAERLEAEDGVIDQLKQAAGELNALLKFDPEAGSLIKILLDAQNSVAEFSFSLERYARGIVGDDEQLEALRERLSLLARLERKYRESDEGLEVLLERFKSELSALSRRKDLKGLEAEERALHAELLTAGANLSKARREAGDHFAKAICKELQEVGMGGATLSLKLEQIEPSPAGMDRVEILFSANKGEPMRQLKTVASGGELSRLLLVMKKALRDRSGVNVLVFDEVDTGISGAVARAVGIKLRGLAEYSQVICVTHLPQVASLASHHFVARKFAKGRTTSLIAEVVKDEQVEEIARMLSGAKVTESSRQSARELMEAN